MKYDGIHRLIASSATCEPDNSRIDGNDYYGPLSALPTTPAAIRSVALASDSRESVKRLTHRFYRYPARFSDIFVREVISWYTNPGDLIVDPFVGGGTTAVEALGSGRHFLGSDLSELAIFISRAKTTALSERQCLWVLDWANWATSSSLTRAKADDETNLLALAQGSSWQLRRALSHLRNSAHSIRNLVTRNFILGVLLRTAQWAFDNRREIPGRTTFLSEFCKNVTRSIVENGSFREAMCSSFLPGELSNPKCHLYRGPAEQLPRVYAELGLANPRLILTSPPYPNVHVLYNRWQIQGRRETTLPFWLLKKAEKHLPSRYTLIDRRGDDGTYFARIQKIFHALAQITQPSTPLIQLVAFAHPRTQLPKYVDAIDRAGFSSCEAFVREFGTHRWREVPGRKWYTQHRSGTHSAKEALLVHRRT